MSKPSDPPKPAALASNDTKGHRARMRQKLLEKGGTALTDLEILEMLLYAGAPRGDISVTKDIDKALAVMGITLHDHLIVAGTNCVSLKNLDHL